MSGRFLRLPASFVRDHGSATLSMASLESFCRDRKTRASIERIAIRAGVSQDTTDRAFMVMDKYGYLCHYRPLKKKGSTWQTSHKILSTKFYREWLKGDFGTLPFEYACEPSFNWSEKVVVAWIDASKRKGFALPTESDILQDTGLSRNTIKQAYAVVMDVLTKTQSVAL